MKNIKILIAGGSGFIGTAVAEYFGKENDIVILSRVKKGQVNNAYNRGGGKESFKRHGRVVAWDGISSGEWCREIDGCNIVINLAGKSVNCRYNEHNKREIFSSRINATRAIGEAIKSAVVPPQLWINAASATIYKSATEHAFDEYNGEYENDFSVQVCKLWERTFFEQRTAFTRKTALRMAVTLGAGGVMIPYLNLCKIGLGGKQGNGRQMYSWVHIEDVCRAIEFLWQQKELEGVYNLSSPNPVTNETFMRKLREVTGHVCGLHAPEWMLKTGATIIGTETELLLKSRWVLPTKLLESGFAFKHNSVEEAFENIIAQLPRKAYHLF
ncbi:MAG TPA: TIGR01777 family oxidoreductase [Panacibacter sp.]|nr:TIGR01777 family oxidoreductase [Panacibacter sp.]HNP44603.1 TIGR01777 family oxidoreductase [Panacibacter sp.]